MRLQTILNRVGKFTSFSYGEAGLEGHDDGPARPGPSGPGATEEQQPAVRFRGGRRGPAYDRLEQRRFEFVPGWGIVGVRAYRRRRVNGARCGGTVEMASGCDGKNRSTTRYRWALATRAERLRWNEVAAVCRTAWDRVRRAVGPAVEWGPAPRALSGLTALGIDEVAWGRGPPDLTRVDDLGGEARRLLAVAGQRAEASLRSGLEGLGETACKEVRFVCSDLGKPSPNGIAGRRGQAVHVLDRSHVMPQFGQALDEVRAAAAKRLERDGYEPVLKRSRGCLLKRPANRTDQPTVKLSELLKYDLRTVRADLLREEFQRLWGSKSAAWAGRPLDEWTGRVKRSRLEPMKTVARPLRAHRPLIRNRFRAKGAVAAGAVEGPDTKVRLVPRKSYGFRTAGVAKLAL